MDEDLQNVGVPDGEGEMNEGDEFSDPQLPDPEDDEVDTLVSAEQPTGVITIRVGKNGSLEVDIQGEWRGRNIRSIQGAVMKAYRQLRYIKYKELEVTDSENKIGG